jgi:hypothetical protein
MDSARDAIERAQRRYDDQGATPRILLINGSLRSEHTCPGEMSKTWRLLKIAEHIFEADGFETEMLDLSRLTSEFGKQIHPCRSCVSTAMPLCHWPCSCYPNYSLGQTDDWMNEIYPMGRRARHHDHHACELVSRTDRFEGDDRFCAPMAGIRIRRRRTASILTKPKPSGLGPPFRIRS